MAILVLDPYYEEVVRGWERDDRYDEVWEGVAVVSPSPNNEHQRFVTELSAALVDIVCRSGRGDVYSGLNVSDRSEDWTKNFRVPDVAVYLTENPAEDRGTFMLGGPDFAVEVASPGEDPSAKLGFYAAVGTRELLVVRRDPWSLELFALAGGRLVSTGRAVSSAPAALTSPALGVTLRLVPGEGRPRLELVEPASGRVWLV